MDCKHADELLVDLLYEELPPDGREAVEAHLAGCARCAGELARLRGVLRLVREQPLGEPSPAVSERILRLARAALDAAPSRAPAPGLWRWAWSPALVAVMVGLVVVAVGLVAFQGLQQREHPELFTREERALPAPAPEPEGQAAAPAASRERGADAPAEARREAQARGAADGVARPGTVVAAEPRPAPAPMPPADFEHFTQGDEGAAGAKPDQALAGRGDPRVAPVAKPAPRPDRALSRSVDGDRAAGPAKAPAADRRLEEQEKAEEKAKGWREGDTDDEGEERRFAKPPPPVAGGVAPGAAGMDAPQMPAAEAPVQGPRDMLGGERVAADKAMESAAAQAKREKARPKAAKPAPEVVQKEAASDLLGVGEEEAAPAPVAPKPAEPAIVAESSARSMDEARKAGGGGVEDLLTRGEGLLSAGDPAGAAEAFGAFLRARPDDVRAPAVRFRWARALFLAGRCAEAILATRQALAARPAHPEAGEALLDQASCEVRLGRFQDAVRTYERVEREHPELADEARAGIARIPR